MGISRVILAFASRLRRTPLRRFRDCESGASAVEYAIMLALILVVCAAAVEYLGSLARHNLHVVSHTIKVANAQP